jgi:hypothetical protein
LLGFLGALRETSASAFKIFFAAEGAENVAANAEKKTPTLVARLLVRRSNKTRGGNRGSFFLTRGSWLSH